MEVNPEVIQKGFVYVSARPAHDLQMAALLFVSLGLFGNLPCAVSRLFSPLLAGVQQLHEPYCKALFKLDGWR